MAGVVDADTHIAESGRRSQQDITVFKNNDGQGIAELAIAELILIRARERQLGIEVTWGEGYLKR